MQAGGGQGQCDAGPGRLCLSRGGAAGGTGSSAHSLARGLHFCWVSGAPWPSSLSFVVTLGAIHKFEVTSSRGENCLFIREWSPEVPAEIRALQLLPLNARRVQGSACSAPRHQPPGESKEKGRSFASVCRRGRETRLRGWSRCTERPWRGEAAALRVPAQCSHLQITQVPREATLSQQT